jgi:uncharacterized protein (TIGR03435 family)
MRSGFRAPLIPALAFLAVLTPPHTANPFAQSQATDSPLAFEIVSIKPNNSGPIPGSLPYGFQPGGRFVARYITVSGLINLAMRVNGATLRPEQIVGAPSWLSSARYDIDAKVANAPAAPIPMMSTGAALLQSLLEDRFKLKTHLEERELPFYAMVLARSNGELGPHLKPTTIDCDAVNRERDAARRENRPMPASPTPGRPLCSTTWNPSLGTATASAATPAIIATILTSGAGRTVLDRTGLTGMYDLDLTWSANSLAVSTTDDLQAAAPSADAPSIFTAVQEQLGLKLEQRREPRDVLVIDHIEPPTPD